MALSSVNVTSWILDTFKSSDWTPLPIVIKSVICQYTQMRDDQASESAEEILDHVKNALFASIQSDRDNGRKPPIELDSEDPPYIRCVISDSTFETLQQLRALPPRTFEQICALLLQKFGARTESEGGSQDGGIDFTGYDLSPSPHIEGMPPKCKIVVLGQAKRYSSTNTVKLNEVRQFVGAAKKRHSDLLNSGRLSPLSPVIYAFWTTSTFDIAAADFGLGLGIWMIDSIQLASYVDRFSILSSLE